MRLLHSVAFGLALASGAASAQAQVITRQVTQEPVETTITRGPAGTIITRRPLAPAPVAPTVGAVTVEQGVAPAYGPLGTVQLEPYEMQSIGPGPTYAETVGIAQPVRTATVRRPVTATRTVRAVRTERRETVGSGVVRRAPRAVVRRTTTVRRTVATSAAPLVLAPAQRQVIYRTVVQRQVVPSVAAYPTYPTYPTYPAYRPSTVVVPATTGTGYAVTAPADDVYSPADDVYYDEAPPLYRSAAVAPVVYPVGARLPARVVLSPVSDEIALRVPAVRSYRTVYINNRVLLVDPVTYTVVADVTP